MKKVKIVFVTLMMIVFLGIGSTSAFSLTVGEFIRNLIGWNYRGALRSCVVKALDMDGNVIDVQGARVDCLQCDGSCTAISCEALQP